MRLTETVTTACALLRCLWAPLFVLVFHYYAVRTPYRVALDNPIHFMGGLAIALFWLQALELLSPIIGAMNDRLRYCFAYALACTVAVFWELAEFASDVFRGTHIQSSLFETMMDLVAGTSGAFLVLVVMGGVRLVQARAGKFRQRA